MRRDYTATVVATGKGMDKHLLVNGIGMTQLTPITKMMAHLPFGFPRQAPEKAWLSVSEWVRHFDPCALGEFARPQWTCASVPAVFGYFHSDGPEIVRSR